MYEILGDLLKRSLWEISIIFIISIILIIIIGLYIPILKIYYPVLYIFVVTFSLEVIFIKYYRIKSILDRDLLYYIAYLYSLSYSTYNIKNLLEMSVEEKKEFKEINSYMEKVLNLVKKYNYTIPEAIRYVLPYVPKSNFKSFLERFATSIDIGEDVSDFLYKEYENALGIYEANYEKGLENIRLLEDLILSLLSSVGFAFSLILFIPFLVSINMVILLADFFIIFVLINIMIYYVSKYYIPDDNIWSKSKEKPKEYNSIKFLFYILSFLSYILFLVLFLVAKLPLIAAFAIAITPLTYVSYRMINLERLLKSKENHFPAFFSSIIEYSQIFGNNQTKILDNVVIHDFGSLNDDIDRLRKRINITKNYEQSWNYFVGEIGSRLSERVIKVFERVLEYSGDTKKAGDMLYGILIKIIELRTRKQQFISNLRGIIYGTYIAFISILFIMLQIIYSMNQMFQGISTALSSATIAQIGINLYTLNIPISILNTYVFVLSIIEAFILAFTIKNIDGGSKIGSFLDATLLIWIAALLNIGVYYAFTHIFSGLSFVKL
ncbi:flagellar assembly protein FlaJ [Nanoarchaeota archaeon]